MGMVGRCCSSHPQYLRSWHSSLNHFVFISISYLPTTNIFWVLHVRFLVGSSFIAHCTIRGCSGWVEINLRTPGQSPSWWLERNWAKQLNGLWFSSSRESAEEYIQFNFLAFSCNTMKTLLHNRTPLFCVAQGCNDWQVQCNYDLNNSWMAQNEHKTNTLYVNHITLSFFADLGFPGLLGFSSPAKASSVYTVPSTPILLCGWKHKAPW